MSTSEPPNPWSAQWQQEHPSAPTSADDPTSLATGQQYQQGWQYQTQQPEQPTAQPTGWGQQQVQYPSQYPQAPQQYPQAQPFHQGQPFGQQGQPPAPYGQPYAQQPYAQPYAQQPYGAYSMAPPPAQTSGQAAGWIIGGVAALAATGIIWWSTGYLFYVLPFIGIAAIVRAVSEYRKSKR